MEKDIRQDRYTPDTYIRTASGTALAVIKLIEIGLCFWFLSIIGSYYFDPNDLFLGLDTGLELSSYSNGIAGFLGFFTCVWIIDSAAVILLRLTGRFSGLIRLIHTLICIALLMGLLIVIVGVIGMFVGLDEYMKNNDLTIYFQSFGLVLLGASLPGSGLSLSYHGGIVRIMRTISIERDTGKRREWKRTGLPGACLWIIILMILPLAVAAAVYFTQEWGPWRGERLLYGILHWFDVARYEPGVAFSRIAYVLFIIDTMAVRACARGYNREHS